MRLTSMLPRWLVTVHDRQFWITANTPEAAKAGGFYAFKRDRPEFRGEVAVSIEAVT